MASLRRMASVLSMRLRECTEGLSCLKSGFVHRAQVMCYAYIFALQNNMNDSIQMTTASGNGAD